MSLLLICMPIPSPSPVPSPPVPPSLAPHFCFSFASSQIDAISQWLAPSWLLATVRDAGGGGITHAHSEF